MTPGSAPVEVRRAETATDLSLLGNLFPIYLHELSAFTDFYEIDDEGRFFPDYLRAWVEHESPLTCPFVIREGGRPAGFALVARAPYPLMSAARDFRMCEFFVLNRARRRGVGRRAARALFAAFPGVWEVSELPDNHRAVSFWRHVIGEHTGGAFTDAVEHGDVVQVFDSRVAWRLVGGDPQTPAAGALVGGDPQTPAPRR